MTKKRKLPDVVKLLDDRARYEFGAQPGDLVFEASDGAIWRVSSNSSDYEAFAQKIKIMIVKQFREAENESLGRGRASSG